MKHEKKWNPWPIITEGVLILLLAGAIAGGVVVLLKSEADAQVRVPAPIETPCEPVVCLPSGHCIVRDCPEVSKVSENGCGGYACCKRRCRRYFQGSVLSNCLRTCRYTHCKRPNQRWKCR